MCILTNLTKHSYSSQNKHRLVTRNFTNFHIKNTQKIGLNVIINSSSKYKFDIKLYFENI